MAVLYSLTSSKLIMYDTDDLSIIEETAVPSRDRITHGSSYVIIGGNNNFNADKYSEENLNYISSINVDAQIKEVIADENHIYIGQAGIQKFDIETNAQAAYNNVIDLATGIVVDNNNVFTCANTLVKHDKQNLDIILEGSSLGTPPATEIVDSDYNIFVYVPTAGVLANFTKDYLTYIGDNFMPVSNLIREGDNLYAAGDSSVTKLSVSTGTPSYSDSFIANTNVLATDGTYLYVSTLDGKIRKLNLSDLQVVDTITTDQSIRLTVGDYVPSSILLTAIQENDYIRLNWL